MAGSVASLVTGAAFLLATCLYWSRDSARAVRPTGTALNKPGRSAEISVSADRFLPDRSACTAAIAVRARARFNLIEYTQDCDEKRLNPEINRTLAPSDSINSNLQGYNSTSRAQAGPTVEHSTDDLRRKSTVYGLNGLRAHFVMALSIGTCEYAI